jgi:hypothetical protein
MINVKRSRIKVQHKNMYVKQIVCKDYRDYEQVARQNSGEEHNREAR